MNKSNQEDIRGNLNYLIIEYLKQTEFVSKPEKTQILKKVKGFIIYHFFFSWKRI